MTFPRFNNLSINKKLACIIIFSCLLISLLSSGFFIGREISTHRRSMVEDLSGLAKVLGINCTAPLEFMDKATAKEILSSLSVRPHILQAVLYTVDGQLFAKYYSSAIPSHKHQKLHEFVKVESKNIFSESSHFYKTHVQLSVPVGEPGKYIGVLVLVADQSAYRAIMAKLVYAVSGIFVATLLLSTFFSIFLNRVISSPIRTLAKMVDRVHEKEDYSIRAVPTSDDEIGLLVQGVNSMLEGIEQRDEQLLVSKKIAEDANKAKSQFLAQMSHEIRTPMNGVLGITSLLSQTTLNNKQIEYVRTIDHSGKLLLNLIDDILDFSKIEAGKLELEEIPFSLRRVVEETLDLLSERASENKTTLSLDLQSRLLDSLIGDPRRLSQILMNLLGNAIKFTHHGEILLTVSFEKVQNNSMRCQFAIKDSGVGIKKEKQELIFAAFTQADGSTTRQYGGTGLGLTICQELVQAMGGEIWVESTEGKGATFCFTALLAVDHSHAFHVEKQHTGRSKQFTASILVAEDNTTNQLVAMGMLEHLGCQVDIVDNGLEAIKAVEKNKYDLIFIDCQMPVMNGYDATENIRKLEGQTGENRTPIIALTAQAMKGDREHCLAIGMNDYISKPFTEKQLERILAGWLPGKETVFPEEISSSGKRRSHKEFNFVHIDKRQIDMLKKIQKPGQPDVLVRLLTSFQKSSQEILQSLSRAVTSNDMGMLSQSAHSLKSSSGNFGALHLSKLCRELELFAKENRIADPKYSVEEIETEYEAVVAELKLIVSG